MITSKYVTRVCVAAAVLALLVAVVFLRGGMPERALTMGYEDRLFDTTAVHTIDILIDDWDAFLATAQSEEYTVCDVVIDGEVFRGAGIRGKGNTSLSTVAAMDSDRYSFKLEFDRYDAAGSYYGLDKLSLNNLIHDNTMMKDYLTYRMMQEFGVAAPLCSYVYITVNGEDWGLYLAVEAVEESFLRRNYGSGCGQLYKPDSTQLGGGRGNGQDFRFEDSAENVPGGQMGSGTPPEIPGDFDPARGGSPMPGGQPAMPENGAPMEPSGRTPGNMSGGTDAGGTTLTYTDDRVSSYDAIFSNAKTAVTGADRQRLIRSLKILSQDKDPAAALDVDAVIRYFVVHNYVVNADSYTGSMVHNYYLYEDSGKLSMIPWDYNLAFGTFHGGSAAAMVSDDIDAPLSVGSGSRPMIDWIFRDETYTALYHTRFREFLESVDAAAIIDRTRALISPWVERDPTAFCTYAEFEQGVQTLSAFCRLRSISVLDQLSGGSGAVDASGIDLSDMGTMNRGTDDRINGAQGGMPRPGQQQSAGAMPAGSAAPPDPRQVLLPLVTMLVLAAGLFFAFRFRR